MLVIRFNFLHKFDGTYNFSYNSETPRYAVLNFLLFRLLKNLCFLSQPYFSVAALIWELNTNIFRFSPFILKCNCGAPHHAPPPPEWAVSC